MDTNSKLANLCQGLEGHYLKLKHKAILPTHPKQVSLPDITMTVGKDKGNELIKDLL